MTKGRSIRHVAAERVFFTLFFLLACLCPLLPVTETCAQEGRDRAASLSGEAAKLSDAGNLERAVEVCREAVKADPAYPEAYDQLGYLLFRKGSFDEAVGAFKSALRINQGMRTSRTGLGLALLKTGDTQGAEAVLREALSMNPYPSMTHYALGLVHEKKGDYEKAVLEFKEGIRTFRSGKR